MTDVFISGAGLAGMILAARLAQMGLAVTICDPSPPPDAAGDDGSDLRSTAYLEPSVAQLELAGLWRTLAPHATPLKALRVIDTTGWPPVEQARRTFHPGPLGLSSFGRNIPNWRARKVMAETLRGMDGVDLRLGTAFTDLVVRDDMVRVRLDTGDTIRARLVVGADGRASPVRQSLGIDVRTRRYAQKAFAFAVSHDDPHDDISTEIYNSGGAFTTVPLHDHDGRPASSIVWMNHGPRARELTGMGDDAFARALNERSFHILGRMEPLTPIRTWPIVTQTAERMHAGRVVLLAEAAHVLPPIGAQGLNTSIADVAALCDAISTDDPGAPDAIARYARTRERDMAVRAGAIDLFNRVCQSDNGLVQGLRRAGLAALHDIGPLRLRVMQAGLGGSSENRI